MAQGPAIRQGFFIKAKRLVSLDEKLKTWFDLIEGGEEKMKKWIRLLVAAFLFLGGLFLVEQDPVSGGLFALTGIGIFFSLKPDK